MAEPKSPRMPRPQSRTCHALPNYSAVHSTAQRPRRYPHLSAHFTCPSMTRTLILIYGLIVLQVSIEIIYLAPHKCLASTHNGV